MTEYVARGDAVCGENCFCSVSHSLVVQLGQRAKAEMTQQNLHNIAVQTLNIMVYAMTEYVATGNLCGQKK